MSHGAAGVYAGAFFGAATVCFFLLVWRWRRAYAACADPVEARRSLVTMCGIAALFLALWLTCGRVALAFEALRYAIAPLTLAGFAALAVSAGHRT